MVEPKEEGRWAWGQYFPEIGRGSQFQREFKRAFLIWGYAVAALLIPTLAIVIYCAATLPPLSQVERYEPGLITHVKSFDGKPLHEFYTVRREWRDLRDMPATVSQAVTSIEDRDFWRHGGIDLSALPSALLPLLHGGRARGGSTLTQQLAKNAFLGPERSLLRKIRELLIAFELERTHSKQEILELYLNQAYLGAGAWGFSAASHRYYSKPLEKLRVDQIALLAGLLSRPESLRPDKHGDAALERRNVVLETMVDEGYLTRDACLEFKKRKLDLHLRSPKLQNDFASAYLELVHDDLDKRFGEGFADSAGATVQSTLDIKAQRLADSLVAYHLDTLQARMNRETIAACGMASRLHLSEAELLKNFNRHWIRFDSLFLTSKNSKVARICPEEFRFRPLQAALVLLDTRTGGVRALVGGLEAKSGDYNRATQALRSPGSAFKPLVYGAAIEKGASAADRIEDGPFSLPDPDDPSQQWSPHNLEFDWDGVETYRRALYRSRNIPAIKVALSVGLDTVIEFAHRLGLSRPIRAVPALALGALETTPWEMASAFRVFPQGGIYQPSHVVESVWERTGTPVDLGRPHQTRVMSAPAAWILWTLLRDVNIRGTAAQIWATGFTVPSGGKTGTSNDHRDAWYVGFTAKYTAAIWVGNDDFKTLDGHFTGTDAAMPIWLDLMRALHRGQKAEEFVRPDGVEEIGICLRSGRAAAVGCDSVAYDFRVKGFPRRPVCGPAFHPIQKSKNIFGF